MRYFFLYVDNNKDVSRKGLFIKHTDCRLARMMVHEEIKDKDPKSSVEAIDKYVSIENSKMKRFMEIMGGS